MIDVEIIERPGRNDAIAVAAPFRFKDKMRQIPGGQWSRSSKRWLFPATPAAAEALHVHLNGEARFGSGFDELLKVADRIERAQAIKHADELPPLPIETPTRPWRHQLAAFHFCRELPAALLYLGMGTGKTRIALDLIVAGGFSNVLIVCPLSVVPAWLKQAAMHAPNLRLVALDEGSVTEKAHAAQRALAGAAHGVVINYESAWRDPFGSWALGRKWDLVIADEIHRIKSPGSKVSMYFHKLGRHAAHRLGLSGTPLAHSPMDAYGVFRFLDPGIFGTSFVRFRARYAVMGGYQNHQIIDYINQDEFNERFYSITFRADRDVLDLPETQQVERTFRMPDKAMKAYRELRDEFITDLDGGIVTATNALTRLLRLQQLTSGYIGLDDSIERIHGEKERLLAEVLEEIDTDEPVVVFCRFRQDLEAVHRAAKRTGRSSAELSGSRHELGLWQDGFANVLAVQIQSGGEGVDLTRARYCVYYSLGFSLSQYEQSLARVHRPGQDRNVVYVHLIAESTVDRKVHSTLARRKKVIETILAERGI